MTAAMHNGAPTPDEIVDLAVAAARRGDEGGFEALDPLPSPVYITNSEGRITYYNPACIGFSGREPQLGLDSWCVTWKLYSNQGQFLPHDQCPMAVAIREQRAVRGVTAIAERPDGTRVNFLPFPTPVVDDEGKLIGAVNLLVDITIPQRVRHLREQVARCRRLSRALTDQQTADALSAMATEYEQLAVELERAN